MVEAETVTPQDVWAGLDVLVKLVENLVAHTATALQESNPEDVELFLQRAGKSQK